MVQLYSSRTPDIRKLTEAICRYLSISEVATDVYKISPHPQNLHRMKMIPKFLAFIAVGRLVSSISVSIRQEDCGPNQPCQFPGLQICCMGEVLDGISTCRSNGRWVFQPCQGDTKTCVETGPSSSGSVECV